MMKNHLEARKKKVRGWVKIMLKKKLTKSKIMMYDQNSIEV